MKLIIKLINILDVSSGKPIKMSVQQVHTGQRRIISAAKDLSRPAKFVYGISEMDSHADTIFSGANFCILKYTGK